MGKELISMEQELQNYDSRRYNVLARPEDLHTSPLISVELSVVKIDPRDVRQGGEVHNIGGQLTPSRSALDKIADATGISFTRVESHKEGPTVWVATVSGRRKGPDGTWRECTATYELDLETRAEEIRQRQEDPEKAAKEILQLKKFARQRCDTGARLRVIRALTGLKSGFSREEVQRPFVFPRFRVNTEAMLQDPEMKRAVVNQALGVQADLFGPASVSERNVTPREQTIEIAAPDPDPEPGERQEADPFALPEEELTPEQEARLKLQEWLDSPELEGNASARELIVAMLENEHATLKAMQNLIQRAEAYANRLHAKGGVA